MKYVPPYGVSDPEANYVNGNPATGQQGSIPPAAAFENPQREIVNVISKSNLVPTDADLQQLAKAIRSQFLNYVDDTGSINNLSVALDPPLASYTRGLVLRVRVRNTNSGAVRINAGAGSVPVRKMNGADIGDSELPAGALATLVYDGAVFQLSNFGGAGGGVGGDVFKVNIPYTVDVSPQPGLVIANFTPAITDLVAGDVVAVKINNTNPGVSVIEVNGMPAITLLPNGGGGRHTLQGDLHKDDVMILFYDGVSFWFTPNPEIDARVQYSVGAGQQFISVDDAMDALKRKTIGANGYVTLQLIQGVFSPIDIDHPSADRLKVRGTMIGATPIWNQLAATSNTAAARAQDAANNLLVFRSRYGTEIRIGSSTRHAGLNNSGPGNVTFEDLLVVGNQRTFPHTNPQGEFEHGVFTGHTCMASCFNIACWGCQYNFWTAGGLWLQNCLGSGATAVGYETSSGSYWTNNCSSLGSTYDGFGCNFANANIVNCRSLRNGQYGVAARNGSGVQVLSSNVLGNAVDLFTHAVSSLVVGSTAYASTSPVVNVFGNYGSMIAA